MFFSVVTKRESFCLVMQGLALKHVDLKGYLLNDIKANNVVLEKDLMHSLKFKPVLIDFGKGKNGAESSEAALSTRKRPTPAKTYLAPEVIKNRIYSIASDLYSLGRMLKAVRFILRFMHWPRKVQLKYHHQELLLLILWTNLGNSNLN